MPDTYLQYGPPPYSHGALYRPRSVPAGQQRASSRSPPSRYTERRERRIERSPSRSSSRSCSRSAVTKAKDKAKDTFTDSSTGLGVGVLGAILGGLAASSAADATARSRSTAREHQKARLISTVVGAAVGGLGANAFEKRRTDARERDVEAERDGGKRGSDRNRDRVYYEETTNRGVRPRRGSIGSDGGEVRRYVPADYDQVYERRPSSRRDDDRPLRPGW